MTPVLSCLLCALIGSLLVSAWILAGVLWLLRDYLIAKTAFYRAQRLNWRYDDEHID